MGHSNEYKTLAAQCGAKVCVCVCPRATEKHRISPPLLAQPYLAFVTVFGSQWHNITQHLGNKCGMLQRTKLSSQAHFSFDLNSTTYLLKRRGQVSIFEPHSSIKNGTADHTLEGCHKA